MISLDNIETDLGDGTASLQFDNVAVLDWLTVNNSAHDGSLVPNSPFDATLSLNIQWSSVTRTVKVKDTTNGFRGKFLENTATISVSVQNTDGSFSFAGSGDTSNHFAEIGKERNGVFFSGDDEDDD